MPHKMKFYTRITSSCHDDRRAQTQGKLMPCSRTMHAQPSSSSRSSPINHFDKAIIKGLCYSLNSHTTACRRCEYNVVGNTIILWMAVSSQYRSGLIEGVINTLEYIQYVERDRKSRCMLSLANRTWFYIHRGLHITLHFVGIIRKMTMSTDLSLELSFIPTIPLALSVQIWAWAE